MKLLKKCALVMAVFLLALPFAACSSQERKLPGWVEGKKNLVFYVYDQIEYYNQICKDFNEKYAEDNVNVVTLKAADSYYGDLMNSYVSKQTPDIVFMEIGNILPFLNGNSILLEPLDEYLADETLSADGMNFGVEDLWPANDGYRYNAETKVLDPDKNNPIYAVIKDFSADFPVSYSMDLMLEATAYENEDEILPTYTADGQLIQTVKKKTVRDKLLKANSLAEGYPVEFAEGESPLDYTLTWTEFNAFALAMKHAGANNGVVLDASPDLQIQQWIAMNGESLFDEDGMCKDIVNTPEIRAAFDNFKILQDAQLPDSPTRWINGSAPGYQQFMNALNGSLSSATASTCYGRWAYSQFGWDKKLDKIGYCAPPLPDDYDYESGNMYSAVGGAMGLAITSPCKYKDEAWKFIEYFMTTVQEEACLSGFNISGNKTIAEEVFLNTPGASDEYNRLNSFFYNLSMNSETLPQNRYLTQEDVKKWMWYHLSGYFFQTSGRTWEETLEDIRTELNTQIGLVKG